MPITSQYFATMIVKSAICVLEHNVCCAIDKSLEPEEEFRDAARKQYASANIRAELLIIRNPGQDLLLEFKRVLVAPLCEMEVGVDAIQILDIEAEIPDCFVGVSHDYIVEFVE